jgi:hydroxyacylglutathione hydrolase
MLEIHQFAYGSDNYGVLLHCPKTGETAMVDAGDADAAQQALTQTGWQLSQIWITHHHGDHTAGLASIKAAHKAHVIGPVAGTHPIAGVDQALGRALGRAPEQAMTFTFAGQTVHVLATPGHTLDMINFYLPDENLVFTGDTLFAMGCGRLFEGDAAMMWASLKKLMALPDNTVIYCSHEYTAANAAFALSIDPDNTALATRAVDVQTLRANGKATIPTTMALEKATNPFLRASDATIRAHLGMEGAPDGAVFAEVRRRKDSF